MNKKSDNVLVIFAKKPEIGKVKTRIAKETSDKFALDFAKACFADIVHKLRGSDFYDLIVAVDTLEDLAWFQKYFALNGLVVANNSNFDNGKKIDGVSDKFEFIFSSLINHHGYKKALLIPMDVPFISEEDIITAFTRLNDKKYILGPEMNGGVYLVGVNSLCDENIFIDVRWSTANSFNDLLRNAKKENCYILKIKNDLNMPEDILFLHDEIKNNCPSLYDFLIERSYFSDASDRFINYDNIDISIPLVINIVLKNEGIGKKLLIKKRYKPISDPKNTYKLELPSSLVNKYESIFDSAKREARDELGINVSCFGDDALTFFKTYDNEEIATFKFNDCFYQAKGGRSYLYFIIVTFYDSGELKRSSRKSRDSYWIDLSEAKEFVREKKNDFYFPSYVALKRYLNVI